MRTYTPTAISGCTSWTSPTFLQLKQSASACHTLILVLILIVDPRKAITVEKEIPLEVDVGYLTVTDLDLIDQESYTYVMH